MGKHIEKHATYGNIRNIVVEGDSLCGLFGKHVASTGRYDDVYTQTGKYVYCLGGNAYRIDKDFFSVDIKGEAEFVSKLQDIQPEILLTEFPTGIITFQGRVIGQETPYYGDFVTIHEYFTNNKVENPYPIFRSILDILVELYDHGIAYTDIHDHNFMIAKESDEEIVKAIDFEQGFVSFSDKNKYYNKMIAFNYIFLINSLLEKCEMDERMAPTEDIKKIYQDLNAKEYTLVCKR